MNTVKRVSPLFNYLRSRSVAPIIARSASDTDVVTHTGQQWEPNDYRLVRFMNAPKQVNPNWSVNLIAAVPPKETTKRVVWCDGGDGPEGHPRVYINLDKPGDHACGYCGLRFVKIDDGCH
ncbi:probable NADH dehydrogenase [ubiquinone] iron-sulfur protein 6, mitochondrial [Pectinophora gossypiella]|uniref:probable NADH dehydrogenase [ubiquinone] iron-sulfur protein 6, mitochondrial n=1 Tax=Pectinophora gossypiella TaxID=13191 RepID=UPI00214EDE27|nr:probable NADH dehydrogenase [ubiquinone] iron-sulfur protein 6, mitochondrial [Pectinophora gossypiella]